MIQDTIHSDSSGHSSFSLDSLVLFVGTATTGVLICFGGQFALVDGERHDNGYDMYSDKQATSPLFRDPTVTVFAFCGSTYAYMQQVLHAAVAAGAGAAGP